MALPVWGGVVTIAIAKVSLLRSGVRAVVAWKHVEERDMEGTTE